MYRVNSFTALLMSSHSQEMKINLVKITNLLLLLANFCIAIPMDKTKNGHSQQSIKEMLSGLIYDQELRMCCMQIQQKRDFGAILDCSAVNEGALPVSNGGYANSNYYNFFWNCIAQQNDYTDCCKNHGVNMDCLPICNAKEHPSYEGMNILLAKSCFVEMSEILSSCIAKRRGKIRGAEIILHLDNEKE